MASQSQESGKTDIEYEKGWRWPKLVSFNDGGNQRQANIFMSSEDRKQCILIGSYYLCMNISPDKSQKDNLDTFTKNLKDFMMNERTLEDYANDGKGMTIDKINTTLQLKWKNLEPLLFPSLKSLVGHGSSGGDSFARTIRDLGFEMSRDLSSYLFGDAEVVSMDVGDDIDDNKENKENKESKQLQMLKDLESDENFFYIYSDEMLNQQLALCSLKIGCYMQLYYTVKDLYDSNDINNSNNDLSSTVTVFTKYFNYFESINSQSGCRFLLTCVNRQEKPNGTLFDVINRVNNDYLKDLFIGKYHHFYAIPPAGANEDNNASLSQDLLNDLNVLGFRNATIRTDNYNVEYPQLVSLDSGHGFNHDRCSFPMNNVDILQSLLIGCYYRNKSDGTWLPKLGFSDRGGCEDIIKLAMILFIDDSDKIKLLSFIKEKEQLFEASTIFLDDKNRKKLRQDMLDRGCFEDLRLELKRCHYNGKGENGLIGMKFVSYCDYLQFDNVEKLLELMKQRHLDKLMNFVSKHYFSNTESELRDVLMKHSKYIHDCFERANAGFSSLENGTQFAEQLFQDFLKGARLFIVESMKSRLKLDNINNYPLVSVENSKIISALLGSRESTQVVKNHLLKTRKEIEKIPGRDYNCKFAKYYTSKFITSSSPQREEVSISATLTNFIAIYILQISMATRIADICEPGNSIRASGVPFWKWGVIDPCQLVKPRSGLIKLGTVYYFAAKYGRENMLKSLSEHVDNDILKYTINNKDDYSLSVFTESPLDAAMSNGHWQIVKYISLVESINSHLLSFFDLFCSGLHVFEEVKMIFLEISTF